jgi:hypothetical protein
MSDTDPFALFAEWFAEARESEPNDPDAMAFASADQRGRPSVRMVLLREAGPDGFGFFTNLDSRKGNELSSQSLGRSRDPLEVAAPAGPGGGPGGAGERWRSRRLFRVTIA